MKFRFATAVIGAVLAAGPGWSAAHAQGTPGVTATEVKIGHTIAYSGPASAYGVIGKAETAFFKMVNDQGGVAGHMINFISYDDGYTPPKTDARHANQLGDRALRQSEEGADAVRRHRRGQMGRLPALPLDHRLPAQLSHGSADLREVHPGEREGSEDCDPVPE
jgi:hypothetical protein